MTREQNRAFEALRNAWVAHHDLKTQQASISDLVSSRVHLEDARLSALRSLR